MYHVGTMTHTNVKVPNCIQAEMLFDSLWVNRYLVFYTLEYCIVTTHKPHKRVKHS